MNRVFSSLLAALLLAGVASAQQPFLQVEVVGGLGRSNAAQAQIGFPLGALVYLGLRGEAIPAEGMPFGSDLQPFPSLLQLELLAADGTVLPVQWDGSLGIAATVQVPADQPAMFRFVLSSQALESLQLKPGRYGLRARLLAESGPRTRPELTSRVLWFSLLGRARPDAALLPPEGGALVPGTPLLLGVQFAASADFRSNDTWLAPAFDDDRMPRGVRFAVRGPDGGATTWPLAPVPGGGGPAGRVHLKPNQRIGPWWMQVAGSATATLAPGRYEVVMHVDDPNGAFASQPVAVNVLDPVAARAPEAQLAALVARLTEVRMLRQHTQRVRAFLSADEQAFRTCAQALQGIATDHATLAAVAPGPRVQLVLAEWKWLRDDGSGALAILNALPPAGADARLAAAVSALRTRLDTPFPNQDYFAPYWQRELQRLEAAGGPTAQQPAPATTEAPAPARAPATTPAPATTSGPAATPRPATTSGPTPTPSSATTPSSTTATAATTAAAPAKADANVATATLRAPGSVKGNSSLTVEFSGPNSGDTYIVLAKPGAPATIRDSVAYTSVYGTAPVSLYVPPTPGRYELRYLDARNQRVLASREVIVTP